MFILYSADIGGGIKNSKYNIYADDTQLYMSTPPLDAAAAVNLMNRDLYYIAAWCDRSCLVLKCKMYLRRDSKSVQSKLCAEKATTIFRITRKQ